MHQQRRVSKLDRAKYLRAAERLTGGKTHGYSSLYPVEEMGAYVEVMVWVSREEADQEDVVIPLPGVRPEQD
jgi:hypothetical protein